MSLPKKIILRAFLNHNIKYLYLEEAYLGWAGHPALSRSYASGGGTWFFTFKSMSVGNLAPKLNLLLCIVEGMVYLFGAGRQAYFIAFKRNDWNLVSYRLEPKVRDFFVMVDGILYFWGEGKGWVFPNDGFSESKTTAFFVSSVLDCIHAMCMPWLC